MRAPTRLPADGSGVLLAPLPSQPHTLRSTAIRVADFIVVCVLGGALNWALVAATHLAIPDVVPEVGYPANLLAFTLAFAVFRRLVCAGDT